MKKTSENIDRGTLLLSGGTAALATLLLGAAKNPAKRVMCCDPIDLAYENAGSVKRAGRVGKATTALGGVRVVARSPNDPTAPHFSGWNLIGLIAAAKVDGRDEHGGAVNQPLGYDLWVYTK